MASRKIKNQRGEGSHGWGFSLRSFRYMILHLNEMALYHSKGKVNKTKVKGQQGEVKVKRLTNLRTHGSF